ncbi:MAG: T9SS type A sorting domain-containing protein, partial [Bacteroidales bacterium]|nr:T9SS type A sorting domain-containing protein [Bacteroidales bacterium]
VRLHTWGDSQELDKLTNKNFTKINDNTWEISFGLEGITLSGDAKFGLWNESGEYLKAKTGEASYSWYGLSKDNGKDCVVEAGTYYGATLVVSNQRGTVLVFHKAVPENEKYVLSAWNDGVLKAYDGKEFKRIDANTSELVFESPITVPEGDWNQLFLIKKGSDTFRSPINVFDAKKEWVGIYPYGSGNSSEDFKLYPGTYYSVTIKGATVKFNTYAETTTGLDAVLSKSADYVRINTDIYVQEHHQNHYSVYTTQSSTYVAPTPEQDTKYYGDDPEKFEKRDWFRIWAPVESEKNGMHFAAGTIVEIASGKAVKWGDVVSGETSFTPNLYRPLNFSATEKEKDVMYIFQPQQGEVLQVRGKFAIEGGNEFLTDEKAEHKVGLLGFTEKENKMTEGQWYTLDGHLCGNAVYYTGFATATGVESVETANATVFAANGTINVSSESQAAIEVYTANGQMVSAINADNASIAVAPGFYLVKVGNQVSKVVVK